MTHSRPDPGRDTHFGFKTVDLDAKQGLVDDVFRSVARRYDLMNDLMSGGLHRAWKDALVTAVNPPKGEPPFAFLDAAVAFVEGNAEALPFPDKSFDAYTIAFGIRNVPRIESALAEAYRVLKPGARFLCLEFSTVDVPGLDTLYDLYSFNVIPALGRSVAGDADAYRYLVESIRRFPKPQVFAGMISNAGFRRVGARPLTGGVVALHSGWRL